MAIEVIGLASVPQPVIRNASKAGGIGAFHRLASVGLIPRREVAQSMPILSEHIYDGAETVVIEMTERDPFCAAEARRLDHDPRAIAEKGATNRGADGLVT